MDLRLFPHFGTSFQNCVYTGAFSFGGAAAPKPADESRTPAPPTGNDSKPAATTAGFSFGAAASTPASTTGFSFGAGSAPAPVAGDAKAPAAAGELVVALFC